MDPIIDLSHYNANPDFARAKSAGVAGVIHKATQGTAFVDPAYASRRRSAAGLLWGAYHFGTGGDGVEQAKFFLEKCEADASVLLVLDFEANPGGSSMTLAEAGDFVSYVRERTGRWPGIYGGAYLKEQIGSGRDTVLANCWLWLAQYGPAAEVPAGWSRWTMWQYSDTGNVAGIGLCDCDRFNGPAEELGVFWRG